MAGGGIFPVQSLPPVKRTAAIAIWEALANHGVRTVLNRPRCRRGATVTLIVTVRHRPDEINRVAAALAEAVGRHAGHLLVGAEAGALL